MNELQFLSLDSVHISWGIVLFSVWWWRTLHNRYFSVQKWLSPSLDTLLVRTPLRLQMVYFGMVTAGLFCGVVAMMRPVSFGVERVSETSVEADVVIALDVSKSMWAEDAAPNRLDRAKYEIMEMVDAMPGYRFGLVGFAGSASVLCPLTTDVGFFQLALNNASPSSI